MKVSIILPTYNGSEYLDQAIESILNQTYDDFELIIVDDCSTDATPEIINKYVNADTRVRSIRNEVNKKLPESINTGFRVSGGVYISWTSDDNMYKPDAIQRMVNELEGREADIVYANYDVIDETGTVIKEDVTDGNVDRLRYDQNMIGACFLYKREVQEALNGYDRNRFLLEDYDFWLRALEAGFRYHFIDESLYLYRTHEASLSATRYSEIVTSRLHYLEEHKDRCPEQYRTKLLRRLISDSYEIADKNRFREYMEELSSFNKTDYKRIPLSIRIGRYINLTASAFLDKVRKHVTGQAYSFL